MFRRFNSFIKTLDGIHGEIKSWKKRNSTVGQVYGLRTRIATCEKAGTRPVDDLVKDIFKDLGYKDPTTIPFGLYLCVQEQVERAFIRGTCAMADEVGKQIDA